MTRAEKIAASEARHNPNGDPRCVRCRYVIRSWETVEDGHCAHCRGVSSFIVSSAASKALADEFAGRVK